LQRAEKQGKERPSTSGWLRARVLAEEALGIAVYAWDQRKNREESKEAAENAFVLLTERCVPHCSCDLINSSGINHYVYFRSTAVKKLL
jgi:hypothetical protein